MCGIPYISYKKDEKWTFFTQLLCNYTPTFLVFSRHPISSFYVVLAWQLSHIVVMYMLSIFFWTKFFLEWKWEKNVSFICLRITEYTDTHNNNLKPHDITSVFFFSSFSKYLQNIFVYKIWKNSLTVRHIILEAVYMCWWWWLRHVVTLGIYRIIFPNM